MHSVHISSLCKTQFSPFNFNCQIVCIKFKIHSSLSLSIYFSNSNFTFFTHPFHFHSIFLKINFKKIQNSLLSSLHVNSTFNFLSNFSSNFQVCQPLSIILFSQTNSSISIIHIHRPLAPKAHRQRKLRRVTSDKGAGCHIFPFHLLADLW